MHVQRESKLLELIHNDLGDLKNNLIRGGKRFYITLIDDCSVGPKARRSSFDDD